MIRTRLSLVGPLLVGALALTACRPASAQLTFSFTSFDPPAPSGGYAPPLGNSGAYGISNTGAIVGIMGDSTGITSHGYVYQNGSYSALDFPGTTTGGFNNPQSINSAGYISGYYLDTSGNETDYIYHNGTFTTPTLPAGRQGYGLLNINDAGLVASQYLDNSGIAHSSIYNNNTQTFTDLPDASPYGTNVQMVGMNGEDMVNYLDAAGNLHGSVYQNGIYTTMDFSGAQDTALDAINAGGLIAGTYTLNGVANGLAYLDGKFYTVDYPGAENTELFSANDSGEMAGFYQDQSGVYHSLLVQATATPEPGSVAMLAGMSVAGTGFLVRRKRLLKAKRS